MTTNITLQRSRSNGAYGTVHRYTGQNKAVKAKAMARKQLLKLVTDHCSLWQNADPHDTNTHYRVWEEKE